MAVLNNVKYNRENSHVEYTRNSKNQMKQESPADAGIPARRKNDEKNSSISKL